VTLHFDLAPGRDLARLGSDLSKPRSGRSFSEHLRRQTGITGVKAALLREVLSKPQLDDASAVAQAIKRLPLTLQHARPIAEAISSAGGVRLEALDEALMVKSMPGVFCAGEMLDWEAPTGGYLLTACFASGLLAGRGAVSWLASRAR
jgi:predicted flavoprotein YhiN